MALRLIRSLPRDRRALVVAVATIAAVITEVGVRSVGDFWATHPMTAAIVAGLLLLAVGLWVVGVVLEEHTKPVVREAYRSLAADVELVAKVLVWATRPLERLPGGTGADETCLSRTSEAAARVGVQARAPVTERLLALLADDPWRDAARDLLRASRLRLHERAAIWSPVMLASARLTDDLASVSAVSEDLGRLGQALTVEGDIATLVALWNTVKEESLALQEAFQEKSRSHELEARYRKRFRPTKSRRGLTERAGSLSTAAETSGPRDEAAKEAPA